MRSYNEFLPSNWSKPVVLAIDTECDSQTPLPATTNVTETDDGDGGHGEELVLYCSNPCRKDLVHKCIFTL